MPIQIALQLYTLREQAAADFPAMLREVADAGYENVEFAGLGGIPAARLRTLTDDLGLRALSAHIPYARFDEELDAVIAELQTLGCTYAVAPGLPQELRSPELLPEVSERFDGWGAACREAGLRFGYHNHGWELEQRGDTTWLDAMAAQTNPALVDLQIDIYWALVAGAEPVALLSRYAGRVPTLHAKELSPADPPRDTTVGDGVTDWRALLAAADVAGTEWFIVEQEDDPDHAYRDIRRSLANLTHVLATGVARR